MLTANGSQSTVGNLFKHRAVPNNNTVKSPLLPQRKPITSIDYLRGCDLLPTHSFCIAIFIQRKTELYFISLPGVEIAIVTVQKSMKAIVVRLNCQTVHPTIAAPKPTHNTSV